MYPSPCSPTPYLQSPHCHPCHHHPALGGSSDPIWTGPFSGVQAEELMVTHLGHTEACQGWGQEGGLLAVLAPPTLRCPGCLLLGGCLWLVCWVLPERQG